MAKKRPQGKPGSAPSAPPSPPPPRTILASPEQLAELLRRTDSLIGAVRSYEGIASAFQRQQQLPPYLAFQRVSVEVLGFELLLEGLGFHPRHIYGPPGCSFSGEQFHIHSAVATMYAALNRARVSRHTTMPDEVENVLRGWGTELSGGWHLDRGELLPDLSDLLPPLELAVRQLRQVLEPEEQHEEAAPTPPQPVPIIYWLGHKIYRVGDSRPYEVNDDEHAILQAFMRRPAMGEKALKSETNNSDARIILIRLLDKFDGIFSAAILRPPGKSSGGYAATVRKAEQ